MSLSAGEKSQNDLESAGSPHRDASPLQRGNNAATVQTQRLSGWRLFAIQGVLCLGLLLSVMESSIVATALVTIGDDFHDFTTNTWTVLSYLLSFMGLSIVFARLSDVIGRKWAVMSAWLLFTVFSTACGFASSLHQLIAFRTFQGVGGSGLYTLTMVVVPEISPPKLFAIMSASVGAIFAVSAVLGPILGGVITDRSTWRWIFWLNGPFGLLAMGIILLSWPSNSRSLVVRKVRLIEVDWIGATLLVAATVLLVFVLQEAGSTAFAWNSAGTIACFTISGLCWVVFIAWIIWMHYRVRNGKLQAEAIFPLSVVTRGKMAVVITTTLLVGFAFILVLIYLPERFQIVQLQNPIQAGVHMLPMLCSCAVGSAVGGLASSRKNFTFWTLMAGNALVVLGCGLLSTAEMSLEIPNREYGYQVLLGFGVGLVFATATVMCVLEARFRDLAVAQGVVNQARVLGGAISLSVATIIFNNLAISSLSDTLTPDELSQLQKAPTYAYQLPLEKQVAVRQVFGESFNQQLRVCTYVAASSFVVSLFGFSRHPPDVLERKAAHDAILEGRDEQDD